jgi:predicted HicB family RNase H-like nuclease
MVESTLSNVKLITYRGYIAQLETDLKDNTLLGSVLIINDVLTFEGKTLNEAIDEFHFIIDDYLSLCKEERN